MGKGRTTSKTAYDFQQNWLLTDPNCAQLMIREQDRTMDSIVGTLSTLAQQAGLMGQEIVEHNEQVSFPTPRV
jgi:hypothetical protein